MKKRISFIVVVVLVALLVAISGVFAAKTTIRFNFYGNLTEIEEVVKPWISDFETKNPDIKVDFESIGSAEISTKMLISHVGGDAPDVTRIQHAFGKSWASKGILLDLTPYLESDLEFYKDFDEGSLDIYKYNGKQYGLPHTLMSRAILYNKDFFDKAGVEYPNNNWTWTDFAEAAEKLTVREKGRVTQWGFQLAPQVPGMFALFLEQAGGQFYNNSRDKVTFNTRAGLDVLNYWNDLTYKYKASPPPSVGSQLNHEQAFKLGKVAMIITGPWNRPVLEREAPDLNYGYAELPYYKDRSNNYLSDGIGIWSGTKNKEAAWKLVHFIMEKEQQSLWWDTLHSHFPVTKSSLSYLMDKGLKNDELAIPFINGLKYAKADMWHPKYLELQPVLVREIQATLDEGIRKDPLQALSDAEKEINNILAE